MKNTKIAFFGLMPMALTAWAQGTTGSERPNIVWFLTEDVSAQYLAHFNEGRGAATPNVEKLARHGITFMNAYSCAPVSSAARTTLITGCYAPSFEGAFHRTIQPAELPEDLRMFPSYLREAGYYTCNAHKTDYNVKLDSTAWNHVRGEIETWSRRTNKSQPFFLMKTTMTTHESRLQFPASKMKTKKTVTSPDSVYLHPYLPDTPLMRYTYATFYDRINESDRELGQLVRLLQMEGQLDNTFIFYFGDNGGSLPGTKGYTNDIGLHVPLVVYVPEKWKHKVSQAYGSQEKGIVSFMDFAPTVLKLAGVDIPERMDGKPFLGKDVNLKDRVAYGYGDRYDEFYAFNRCIRKGKYRYARNYQPYHSRSLFAFFRYRQAAFREWLEGYEQGKWIPEQNRFFEPMGAEELYDLEMDPNELFNLADSPEYAPVMKSMREALNQNMVAKADLGFLPEAVVHEEALPDADAYGRAHQQQIAGYIALADLQTQPYGKAVEVRLRKALKSADPVERWWALTVCASFGERAKALEPEVLPLLQDERSYVSCRAMVVASQWGNRYGKPYFMQLLKRSKTEPEVLLLLNDLAYLYESKLIVPFTILKQELKYKKTNEDWRLKYLNSFARNGGKGRGRWSDIYQKM